MNRADALRRLGLAIEFKYPMRWADECTSLGDYDGRDAAIDVFNVRPDDQRAFYRATRTIRDALREELAGIILIFHTPESTRIYYANLFSMTSGVSVQAAGIDITLSDAGVGEQPIFRSPLRFELLRAA